MESVECKYRGMKLDIAGESSVTFSDTDLELSEDEFDLNLECVQEVTKRNTALNSKSKQRHSMGLADWANLDSLLMSKSKSSVSQSECNSMKKISFRDVKMVKYFNVNDMNQLNDEFSEDEQENEDREYEVFEDILDRRKSMHLNESVRSEYISLNTSNSKKKYRSQSESQSLPQKARSSKDLFKWNDRYFPLSMLFKSKLKR